MYFVLGEGGAKYGPADVDTLKQWAAENRLSPTSMLEDASTGVQVQASQVPGIYPPAAPSQPTATQSPYQTSSEPVQNPYQQNPYSNPNAAYPRHSPDVKEGTPTIAIVGWVLAGTSLICCPICLGPAAIYCGYKADQEGYKHGKLLMILAAVAIGLGIIIGLGVSAATGGLQTPPPQIQ